MRISSAFLLPLFGCIACGPPTAVPLKTLSDRVAFVRTQLRVNSSDLVAVDVFVPVNADRQPRANSPAVVFVQGGLVAVERYHWLAKDLSERGYVVALARHPNDLAILSGENQRVLLDAMRKPKPDSPFFQAVNPQFIAVAGHSLGGVMAAKAAFSLDYQALIIHASFVDPSDNAQLPQLGQRPTLFLAGEADCQARTSDIVKSWQSLLSRTVLLTLPGVSHFQFTSDDAPDARSGCQPKSSLENAHQNITEATARFLNAAQRGQSLSDAFNGFSAGEVRVR
jgi:Alpha/beta hydrolase family